MILSVGAPQPMWLKDMIPPSVQVGRPPSGPMPVSTAKSPPSPSLAEPERLELPQHLGRVDVVGLHQVDVGRH